jgi:hypothetical protein
MHTQHTIAHFAALSDMIQALLMGTSSLGGVVVSVLATGSKDFGFEPGQGDGFLRTIKNPKHTFLSDRK